MSDTIVKNIELTEEDLDEYLDTLFFAFSKGTANVSPADKKKLRPLLKHYAKMKHPFTACVRDNRKRFGALTEKYCAVLKDLIVGSTKWRGKGKKYTPKNLSEENFEEFLDEIEVKIPEGFGEYLSALTEEDIELMTQTSIAETVSLAGENVVWNSSTGLNSMRMEVEKALREEHPAYSNGADVASYSEYWVEDIANGKALVCYKGTDYYIVPFSANNESVEISDESEWVPVERAWVQANLAQQEQILAEMFFEDDGKEETDEDGRVWKTILREGKWQFSPGTGQKPVNKPITVVKSGKSDPHKLIISMEEIKKNFEEGVIEHVTIPTSHADKVLENTGFIKSLRFSKDEEGRDTLEALHDFTEPEVKEKAIRGTIANTSAGILFDYVQKESGKKFRSVLAHVALTNHPWLNGMKPFGVEASDNLNVIAFSEEESASTTEVSQGGETVSTTVTETAESNEVVEETSPETTFFSEVGLSAEEIRASLSRLQEVEAENKQNRIDSKCKDWQEEGKSPALVKEARAILMSDSGSVAINLSEEGETKVLTLSEVVERLVAAAPSNDLTANLATEEAAAGEKPEDDASRENEVANLSHDEKVLASSLMFDEQMSEEQAIAEAKRRLGTKSE
jgi:hypothetical protein